MAITKFKNYMAGRRKRAMCDFGMFPAGTDLSWIWGIDTPREMWITFGLPKGVLATGTDLCPWVRTLMGTDYRGTAGTFLCKEAAVIAKVGSSSGDLVFTIQYSADGTTWSDMITGLTCAASAHAGTSTAFASTDLEIPNSSYLRLNCTGAGTTTASEEIVVEVRGEMPE
jgi:hypothetical protein